jgi:spore coat polysaccharide biosynthesis protein SpsF
MRVSCIIEARMGSKRLPGKTMKTVAEMPMLAVMIERVWAAQCIDTIVVATPDTQDNAPIWALMQGVPPFMRCVSGPEDDVMSRVLKAAQETKTDIIVEVTGDCPIIDPWCIDLVAGYYIAQWNDRTRTGACDFVGNVAPHTWPLGMDVRVFSTKTLERVNEEVRGNPREAYWREHVSPWMYDRPESPYSRLNLVADSRCTYPDLNLSVDTEDDFKLIKGIVETLRPGNPMFTCRDAIEYVAGLPGRNINLNRPAEDAEWLKDLIRVPA